MQNYYQQGTTFFCLKFSSLIRALTGIGQFLPDATMMLFLIIIGVISYGILCICMIYSDHECVLPATPQHVSTT